MTPPLGILLKVIFLLPTLVHYLSAFKYQFLLENEEIFTDCPNQPKSVRNVHQFVDWSEFTMLMTTDLVSVSGNVTCVWEIQQSDRVQLQFVIYRWDRGTWVSTLLSMVTKDFCSLFYDPTQHWCKYWTRHIINKDEVEGKCVNVPGTKMIHESYDLDMHFEILGPPFDGRHKIVTTFKAFDQDNKERDTSICFEIIGELVRIN